MNYVGDKLSKIAHISERVAIFIFVVSLLVMVSSLYHIRYDPSVQYSGTSLKLREQAYGIAIAIGFMVLGSFFLSLSLWLYFLAGNLGHQKVTVLHVVRYIIESFVTFFLVFIVLLIYVTFLVYMALALISYFVLDLAFVKDVFPKIMPGLPLIVSAPLEVFIGFID